MEMETQMIHRGNKFPVEKPAAHVAHYPKNSDSFCRINDFIYQVHANSARKENLPTIGQEDRLKY